ncbi:MAG: sigma-70 family RNA polymerase sigma factor [Planctomycetes bacterium]|nr:sigma-70 family RNA polymerase sigma factor [Planctomycetota bacterium]
MASHPILSPERERQLVDQVQRGDRGALGELLGAYHKRVYHVILRMVSNTEDAADLTQEVLLRAIKHADHFKGEAKFSTWLLRIAMNLAISHLRRSRVRQAVSLEHEIAGGADQATPLKNLISQQREQTPAHGVETQEQLAHLAQALDQLDPSLRSVILLRDLQGMDYQQIAEVLSVPLGTVKSRLFRARLALRSALDGKLSASVAQDDLDNG